MTYRCTPASLGAAEPLLGSAPTDAAWLLLEHDAPWGARAVAQSDLPEEVRERLLGLDGVRVQLVRRHGRTAARAGVQLLVARTEGPGAAAVGGVVLDDVRELLDLDLAGLAAADLGGGPLVAGLAPRTDPLWLVCANGRRDLCCADLGRPVAAALAARWPEETWETTHLGGHRFAATALALPSGLALGRLAPETAVAACAALAAAPAPGAAQARPEVRGVLRGRVGRSGPQQVAEAAVAGPGAVGAVVGRGAGLPAGEEAVVRAEAPDGTAYDVVVRAVLGPPRRQSCADLAEKASLEHHVVSIEPAERRP